MFWLAVLMLFLAGLTLGLGALCFGSRKGEATVVERPLPTTDPIKATRIIAYHRYAAEAEMRRVAEEARQSKPRLPYGDAAGEYDWRERLLAAQLEAAGVERHRHVAAHRRCWSRGI